MTVPTAAALSKVEEQIVEASGHNLVGNGVVLLVPEVHEVHIEVTKEHRHTVLWEAIKGVSDLVECREVSWGDAGTNHTASP